MSTTSLRTIRQLVQARKVREGAGFIVARPIGGYELDHYDPFLLLDHFGPVDYKPGEAKGAPWHPHRGFETVSYMLQGQFRHRDSMGNTGLLGAGSAQWMTAGSGIIHDEMPGKSIMEKGGAMEGFQLWVNLPAKDKMIAPYYQDVAAKDITLVTRDSFEVKIVAGEFDGTKAVINTRVPIHYLDFHCKPGASILHTLPNTLNALVYVYRGTIKVGQKTLVENQMVTFELDGEGIQVTCPSDGTPDQDGFAARFLLLAGQPLNEPIARQGPFVMNTREEVRLAFQEYYNGTLTKHKAQMVHETGETE